MGELKGRILEVGFGSGDLAAVEGPEFTKLMYYTNFEVGGIGVDFTDYAETVVELP